MRQRQERFMRQQEVVIHSCNGNMEVEEFFVRNVSTRRYRPDDHFLVQSGEEPNLTRLKSWL